MSLYSPDRWEVVEIESAKHGKIRKVLASWYGGYTDSDKWRMSSGITEVRDLGELYEFVNESGSIYRCDKSAQGMSGYTRSVFEHYVRELKSQDAAIRVVEDY
jgi:hypothetical protein